LAVDTQDFKAVRVCVNERHHGNVQSHLEVEKKREGKEKERGVNMEQTMGHSCVSTGHWLQMLLKWLMIDTRSKNKLKMLKIKREVEVELELELEL
jgi:hypothetical protein